MAKKPFVAATSKNVDSIDSKVKKGISSGKLGNAVIDRLTEKRVAETTQKCVAITEKAVKRIEELNKDCDKANNIKEDVNNFSKDGVKVSTYSEELWKKKNKPFDDLEKVTTAFDAAIASGQPEDFYKLEKLL